MFVLPINSPNFIAIGAALCLVVLTLLYAIIFQIQYIGLTEEYLIIKKMVGKVTIPRCDILQIQYKKSLMFDLRLWGISGLFGHLGWFWNRNTGKYFAFVKDGNSMLEIKTKGKCYVISCNDYGLLLSLLNRAK